MRPSQDEYFLQMAKLAATRATCPRRQVGCVIVDQHNHVLASGYNGTPRGISHCIEIPCPGANAKSGKDLEKCQATHAEQNALLQCKDTNQIHTVYTTTSPCIHCVKLIMNTSCQFIVFAEEYSDPTPKEMWLRINSEDTWVHKELDTGELRVLEHS